MFTDMMIATNATRCDTETDRKPCILEENPQSLTELAKAAPRVNGKRVHPSTYWRWCRKGINGVRLEYARLGRRIVSSPAALARFTARLAELDDQPTGSTSPTVERKQRTEAAHRREVQRAEAVLAAAGI